MPAFNTLLTTLSLAVFVAAGPAHWQRASFTLQNGLDAQALNAQFQSLTASSPCTSGQNACVNGQFAQCVNGQFELTPCAGGLTCVALPLVNSPGTRYASHHQCFISQATNQDFHSTTCDTVADATARIAATGATGGLVGRSLQV